MNVCAMLRWQLCVLSAMVASCSSCPQPPSAPEAGTYEVLNQDELRMTVTSVTIAGSSLTIEFVDEFDVPQKLVYEIGTL